MYSLISDLKWGYFQGGIRKYIILANRNLETHAYRFIISDLMLQCFISFKQQFALL